MYSIGDFIKSSTFYKHLFMASAIACAIVAAVLFWVKSYTLHGETIAVPGLKNKTFKEAEKILLEKGLKIKIMDSIFNPGSKRGAIIEQNPDSGLKVKRDRTIYLTINAFNPPQVSFPNLKDVSFRQAKSILESIGLEVGNLKYVPDIAKEAVLKSTYKGKELKQGTMMLYGTKIDLTLGDGLKGEKVDLPDLFGLSREEAHNIINDLSLVVGSEIFDSNFKGDSSMAKVKKQTPTYTPDGKISIGSPIDLFYSNEIDKKINDK